MPEEKLSLVYRIFRYLFGAEPDDNPLPSNAREILIVRQHNQLGDLLASSSLFCALKERYPDCRITIIVSPDNANAVVKNSFIDERFTYNKKRLIDPVYFVRLIKLLRRGYDITIVPAVVSVSFTSNLLAGISKSPIKIGPRSLNGTPNKSSFFFTKRVDLDWRSNHSVNTAVKSMQIVKPFGISTDKLRPVISYDDTDREAAGKFLSKYKTDGKIIVGMHPGAGKPPNRWDYKKFAELIRRLKNEADVFVYLTAGSADGEVIARLRSELPNGIAVYTDGTIPSVAALIDMSDLFITNDTGIMHAAGAAETPQISLFGPTDPVQWAPAGDRKKYIKRSDDIDEISVDDVFEAAMKELRESGKV